MTENDRKCSFGKLFAIADKYNKMYHRTKKVMFIDAISGRYINFDSKNKDKDPNLYLVIA